MLQTIHTKAVMKIPTGSLAHVPISMPVAWSFPKGSNSLADAIVKECKDITDINIGEITLTFVPPRGNRYAVVTFLVDLKQTYDTQTYEWVEDLEVPLDYRSGEEAISLCAEGMMLKDNLCFNAQPVCLDKYSTNLCDNAYSLFVLDYGLGFREG